MKKVLFLFAIAALSVGASSCQKCAECDCPIIDDHDFCVEDFDSKDDFDAAVANFEASGCDCTTKLK